MNEFIDYQIYPSFEEAKPLMDLLDANDIPFEIDNSNRFDLVSSITVNLWEQGVTLKIRAGDKKIVDRLNRKIPEQQSDYEHYMCSLSDEDIMDAVINPGDWTEEETLLATEIMKQRNLRPTPEMIKHFHPEKDETATKQRMMNLGGAVWFLCIGVLSMVNIAIPVEQYNAGLGINYVIFEIAKGITGVNIMPLAYVITLIISVLYIFLWYKSKKDNKTAYLIGLIAYGFDTILVIFPAELFNIICHAYIFLMLFVGYKVLTAKN